MMSDTKLNVKHKISPRKSEAKKVKLSPYKSLLLEEKKENYANYFADDDDFFNLKEVASKQTLDLSEWTVCRVEDISRQGKSYDLVLNLRCTADHDKSARVHLQAPWSHTRLTAGDKVSIIAVWDAALEAYKVDRNQGYCITNPDTLISGTTVVASLFCSRKAALQQRFGGIDGNNKVMVIGTLVHELFQNVLKQQLKSVQQIKKAAEELLNALETSKMLYDNSLEREEVATEVKSFIPNLFIFVKQYILAEKTPDSKNFQGKLTSIKDIEENLWVPRLGLKGRVDVTVHVRRSKVQKEEIMPLELKTGRASFSMEHKGQILLYQMMHTALGRKTNGGLLLYLREGIMRELTLQQHNEQRDLIMLRNDMCYYIWQANKSDESTFQLPAPISHHSACSNCAYATICCAFAHTDAQTEMSEKHPLRNVMKNVLSHLKEEDFAYFTKWCSIIMWEELETRAENSSGAFWNQSPEERQAQARALIGLKLQAQTVQKGARYLNSFSAENVDFTKKDVSKKTLIYNFSPENFTVFPYFLLKSA